MGAPDAVNDQVDPRVERSRTVVRQAALVELGQRGYGGFTIDGVANRAGVARSTIYRHWPDKLALITDAFEVLNRQPVPEPDSQDARAFIRDVLVHLTIAVTDSTLSACVPALIEAAEQHPEVRQLHHQYSARRRRALTDAVAAGVARGEIDDSVDPELAAQSMAGAIFYRRLMTAEPFRKDEIDDLINLVLGPPS